MLFSTKKSKTFYLFNQNLVEFKNIYFTLSTKYHKINDFSFTVFFFSKYSIFELELINIGNIQYIFSQNGEKLIYNGKQLFPFL